MQDIKVGRYDQKLNPDLEYGGWVEDESHSWILYLDTKGKPDVMWTKRGDDGAVIGKPITF